MNWASSNGLLINAPKTQAMWVGLSPGLSQTHQHNRLIGSVGFNDKVSSDYSVLYHLSNHNYILFPATDVLLYF